MPTSLSIASGKGGVGKTTLAINLAIMQAKISNCLLLDADMGMANAHILLGINPDLTIKDFFDGSCSLEKVIAEGPEKLKFISGGSGITEMLNVDKMINPLRRNTTQEDVGNVAAFLCSDLAAGVTGEVVHVDGQLDRADATGVQHEGAEADLRAAQRRRRPSDHWRFVPVRDHFTGEL